MAGALALAAGTGIGWVATADDESSGVPGTPTMVRPGSEPAAFGEPMERSWRTPDIGGSDGDDPYIAYAWTYEGVLLRVDSEGVRGLDTDTGEQRWEAQLPQGADEFCGTTEPEPATSIAVLVYARASSDTCERLVAIDQSSGETLWTADAKPPGGGGDEDDDYDDDDDYDESAHPTPVVTEDVIALLWNTENRLVRRYDLRSGEELPEIRPSAQGRCWGDPYYMAGYDHLLLWSRCGDDDSGDRGVWQVSAFDPAGDPEDGPRWTTRVNVSPEETYGPLSEEPLVLYGENGVSAFATDGSRPGGKPTWRVREEGSIDRAVLSETTGDRYLMVQLSRRDEDFLLGFDLATGERLWDRQVFNQVVMGVEGDHALVADEQPDDRSDPDLSGDPPPEDRMRLNWVAFSDGAMVTEGTIPANYGVSGLDDEYVYPVPAWDAQGIYLSLVGETDDADVARTVAFDRNN